MFTSLKHSSSQLDMEEESMPSPDIDTPSSTSLHTLEKIDELHPLTQGLTQSSLIIHFHFESAPTGLHSLSVIPF